MIKKEQSIVWLRCIATMLITNSHFTVLYPAQTPYLSFGGLFGNCLFFFVSGYCLTHAKAPFFGWYTRKLLRVYIPYFLFLPWLFMSGYHFERPLYVVFPVEPYHFLPTIIVLYPLYFFCTYLNRNTRVKYYHCVVATIAVQCAYYFLILDYSTQSVTKNFSIMVLISYFIVMLLGGMLKENYHPKKTGVYFVGAVLTFAVYTVQSFLPFQGVMKLLQWVIAIPFAFSMGGMLISAEERLKTPAVVSLLADMTLEIYLVQYIAIDAYSQIAFPTGLLFCTISIVGLAYALHWGTKHITGRLLIKHEP